MEKGESNNISQQEQIRRYLTGEMSAAEMHALEKQALADPFLADAIEGMASIEQDQLNADLDQLRSRLAEKTEARIVRLPARVSWTRIAVAAAIICIAILSTVLLVDREPAPGSLAANKENQSRKNDSAAKTEELKTATGKDSAELPAGNVLMSKSADSQKKADQVSDKKTLPPATEVKSKKDEPAVQKSETLAEAARPETTELKLNSVALENKASGIEIKPPVAKTRSEVGYLRAPDVAEKNGSNRLYFYTGRVLNAEQQPVSFANIAIKNANSLTYTDAKGNFRLFSADSVLNVDIKSVGYLTNSVVLNYNQPQHQLVLNSLPPKSKKYKSFNKKTTPQEKEEEDSLPAVDTAFVSTEPEAEPVDGWGLYHLYLLNNVRQQRGTDGRTTEGSVVLSFFVNNMGWLSDFKIEKSLNPACDREALRLVREGPKWELYNTEKPIRVKVTVVF